MRKQVHFYFILALLLPVLLNAQVGIGTTSPNASAALDITSTTAGLLTPRMTQAQRDAITSPATGLLIFQTDDSQFYYYDGSAWVPFQDNDWTMHSNGKDMYNANSGNVGVGTNAPTTKLHVEDASVAPGNFFTQDFETSLAPFTNIGAPNWVKQSSDVAVGAFAAGTPVLSSNWDYASMVYNTPMIPAGGATLTFYRKVIHDGLSTNEYTFDAMNNTTFVTVASETVSTSKPYEKVSYMLPAGASYQLTWTSNNAGDSGGGQSQAFVDDVKITLNSANTAAFRLVDGSEGEGYVLTSDANGNASWKKNVPLIAAIDGFEIPICNTTTTGNTGQFNVNVKGVDTLVDWKIVAKTATGVSGAVSVTAAAGGNVDVLRAPFTPEYLQVKYDFTPPLPFNPNGLIFTAYNSSGFPDNFNLNYNAKSASSITVNILRIDTFASKTTPCWTGQFYFNMLITD